MKWHRHLSSFLAFAMAFFVADGATRRPGLSGVLALLAAGFFAWMGTLFLAEIDN